MKFPGEDETGRRALHQERARRPATTIRRPPPAGDHGHHRPVPAESQVVPPTFEEPVIAGLAGLGQDWTWLVRRDHPWRRQLWVKGRNITAGDLVRTASIEGWGAEETAHQFELPLDAVIEALRYSESARELIAAEEAENRIVAKRNEHQRAPVSG